MILHRGSRKAVRLFHQSSRNFFERLEERLCLTTIHGGDIFEYTDATSIINPTAALDRVHAFGPASDQYELIGSSVDTTGNFVLGDVPGLITHPDGTTKEILGGVGGRHGISLIGTVTGANESLTDLVNPGQNIIGSPTFGLPATLAPNAGININAISSNSKGKTWGFNVIQQQAGGATVKRVELVNINYTNTTDPARRITPADAIITADLAPQIAAVTGAADTTAINDVIACDFLPSNDNLLYFAVSVNVTRPSALNPTATPSAVPITFLLRYNFAAPANQAVEPVNLGLPGNATEFQSDPLNAGAGDVAPTVQGFSFTSNDELVAMVTGRALQGRPGQQVVVTATGLVTLNANNPVFDLQQIKGVTLNGAAVTDFRSLEVVPGDDDFVFGITGTGAQTTLLHVNRLSNPTAVASNFGLLQDPSDGRATPRGFNLGDLTWNPVLPNPATGKHGALIVEDFGTDELLVVDNRQRNPATDIYSIYATNVTSASSIEVGRVDTSNPNLPEIPFTGAVTDVGTTRVNGAQGGTVDVVADAGTGRAFIGARIVQTGTPTQIFGPRRIRKPASLHFGNLPNDTKYIYAGAVINGDFHNFLVGGMVMGNVKVLGSANILYAGEWLTGDAQGRLQSDPAAELFGNVYVQNDLRNILTASTFGGFNDAGNNAPAYLSGFSIEVGGKLGFMGAIDAYVGNSTYVSNTFAGNGDAIQEVEDRRGTPTGRATYFEGFAGGAPSLGDTTNFYNDTFETPQYIGTALNRGLGSDQVAVVNGTLTPSLGDNIDYYAMALLAGQSPTVQLSDVGNASITVFDPDGRLIDSDNTVLGVQQALRGHPFRFNADRPGTYRFAVSGSGNYTLRITNVADVALGGVSTVNNIFGYNSSLPAFRVHNGDAGAFASSAGLIIGTPATDANGNVLGYTADRGNLRSIEAPTIGEIPGTPIVLSPIDVTVPRGSVGLVRSTAGDLYFNEDVVPVLRSTGLPNADAAIGGDYQLVSSAADFAGNLLADRAIGTVRAASMTFGIPPYIIANADRRGSDGIIDLVQTTGDLGTFGAGGPHIFTGPGGNMRYLVVGGSTFNSSKFGGTTDLPITYAAGETVHLTDDSGTAVKLTPTPLIPNNARKLATDPEFLNPGQLTVLTYGIDDAVLAGGKGGSVIENVTVGAGPADTVTGIGGGNHGLEVETSAGGSAEIGSITTTDAGRAFVLTPGVAATATTDAVRVKIKDPRPSPTATPVAPDATTPIDLVFDGKSTIDVWSITGTGNIDTIDNETPNGEVVNVTATGVGDFAADWIGIAKSHTGVDSNHSGNAVLGATILDDGGTAGGATTPFVQQRNLIHISGGATPALISARARRGIGNIWVEGIIGNLTADSNGKQGPGPGFDGIDGPIVATAGGTEGGRMQVVNIGQGINFGGRGQVPFAGLFASDVIQEVDGGKNDDIRGPIQINEATTGPIDPIDGSSIGSINLDGGSIINSSVQISENFNDWQPTRTSLGTIPTPATTVLGLNPTFRLGGINISGNGGIIGSMIAGPNLGLIRIDGGFGFLNSNLETTTNQNIAGIDTTGYGVRNVLIGNGGLDVNNIVAEGNGHLLDARSFEGSVAYSTKKKIDPFFGIAPNENTDIYRFLGLGTKSSKKKSISASGVIENTTIIGAGNLDKVQAYQIRGKYGKTSNFAFPQNIGTISVLDGTDQFTLSGGKLKTFSAGADVANTTIAMSDTINTIKVGGTLRGSSLVQTLGVDGILDSLTTGHGLFANVNATIGIGSIVVGTDLGSANISTTGNIDLIQVGGSIVSGATIANIKRKQVTPFRKLSELDVTHNIESGATIRVKTLTKQHVGGVINGNIIVGA